MEPKQIEEILKNALELDEVYVQGENSQYARPVMPLSSMELNNDLPASLCSKRSTALISSNRNGKSKI